MALVVPVAPLAPCGRPAQRRHLEGVVCGSDADHDAYHSCLGDKECNTVEHNTRHHTVNRANYDMVRATATVPVLLGDKTQEQKYKLINKGRCYDIGLLAVPPKLKDILKDPTLHRMFLKYNVAVPSSASVERLFSMAGDVFRRKRGKLSDKNFESQLLLRANKAFW